MSVNKLWTTSYSKEELSQLAKRLIAEFDSQSKHTGGFCLWLVGPLGAGKTTLVGQILKELGLPREAPVTSPTYTYMNEYQIGDRWFAHLDLYRIKPGFSSEDLGLADARPYYGIFVEWPEKSPRDPYLQPTHILTIGFPEGAADSSSAAGEPANVTRLFTLSKA
jgi:tRNA threonylcarbamoyl adenosine modification protein YjeE